ncbi:MAG: bifunctional (p)ppGpp synthetase/guanosine-3',5'-bis(diphosphate) 3'-pyrophosphohydrolase [Oscillochloris sp.]|nr:bifunctional (p)ppGpp synthetase/guanosine-3',5'-bis(diphosphate) 3'-pyrophosphohydrolase [Oscillochloris sp.]
MPTPSEPRPLSPSLAETIASALRKRNVDPHVTAEAVQRELDVAAVSPTANALVGHLHMYAPGGGDLIRRAYALASVAHRGQFRQSGEEYIDHPVIVARLLLELSLEPEPIAAALLHDVVEDTGVPLDTIRAEFGEAICYLVDGVTKLSGLENLSKEQLQASNYYKMIVAAADDPRVLLIKIADRLHNMQTLGATSPQKQRRIARETLDVYAPLAHRLGMWRFKSQLEDLAFRILQPAEYEQIEQEIKWGSNSSHDTIEAITLQLAQSLHQQGITATINRRPRSLYAIWRKMERRQITLDQIANQVCLHVVVSDPSEERAALFCYLVLGIVHRAWTQVPGEFDDYISRPKESSYQSLHTTVIIPGGFTCELQIRTEKMHKIAEYGVATCWQVGLGGAKSPWNYEQKLSWMRDLTEWRKEVTDHRHLVEGLRPELAEQLNVVTPRGDVVTLPIGSTPIDFAYRIHSEIGNNLHRAVVNGKVVQPDTRLQEGDIVEIVTSDEASGPGTHWLNAVRTVSAKQHIKRYLRRKERQETIEAGRQELLTELERLDLSDFYHQVPSLLHLDAMDDVLVRVGQGEISARETALSLLQTQVSSRADLRLPYRLVIHILSNDRVGLMRDITATIAGAGVNIVRVQQPPAEPGGEAMVVFTVDVADLEAFSDLLDQLSHQPDVLDARRIASDDLGGL